MSTTEATPAASAPAAAAWFDHRLGKRMAIAAGLAPGALLAWDALRGQLGVNEVNFAIRTTGLVGLVLLTLSLAISPLRRLTGWTALHAIRRNLGVLGFAYIAAHFAIYFLYDRAASVSSTLAEIIDRVYLWFGAGSLALMIPLAITSTDAMVTRLGARWWKRLHRLAYVAVAAGVVHYYLLVKADTTKPLVFAGVVGALLLFRIGQHYIDLRAEVAAGKAKLAAARSAARAPAPGAAAPRRRFWSGELVVARIFDETPDVKTFRLVAPDGGPLPFQHAAGQYLNVALAIDGARVPRSYTIASSPTRGHYCEISVKRCGLASGHLHDTVREGARLAVSAPAGKFVFSGEGADRVVLVAGGVGITPLMAVIRSLTDRCWPGEIYLLYSVRRRTDVIFEEELAHLQARFPNLRVLITLTGDAPPDAAAAWRGARGALTRELVEGFVPAPVRGPVMVCGPAAMMAAMRALFVDLGVPDADIHDEAFLSPRGGAAPAPAGAELADAPAPADGEPATVRFQRAGKGAALAGLTVLEAAEECGVDLPSECRSGICGQCKTRLVSGRVAMAVQDALTPADRARGLILACQARPAGDVVIDA